MDDKLERKFNVLLEEIHDIKCMLSRIDGMLLERGQWEGKMYVMQKTITEEKK